MLRRTLMAGLCLIPCAAWAQGGNIGEGSGWGGVFLVLAVGTILLPGLGAMVALLLLGRRRPVRRGWAIAGAFLVPLPAGVLCGMIAAVLSSFALYVLLLLGIEALYVLIFGLVWRRHPRR